MGYQSRGASNLIERQLLEGETSQQALAKAKNVGLTVVGWNVEALNSKLQLPINHLEQQIELSRQAI